MQTEQRTPGPKYSYSLLEAQSYHRQKFLELCKWLWLSALFWMVVVGTVNWAGE